MHFGKEDVNLSLLADDMIATFKFILKKSKNKKKGGEREKNWENYNSIINKQYLKKEI